MRGFKPPEGRPPAEWLVDEDEARRIYQSDTGGRRVEWTTPAHRALHVAAPFLRTIKNSNGNLSAAQLSDSVRLLAEVVLSLMSVALHQENPEDDPISSIPPGEG
jgi:hypothetical protein